MNRLSSNHQPGTTGYRLPAEWDRHLGTWLSWPHNRSTWPADLPAVEQAFVDMVAALAPGEAVHINVLDATHRQHVAALLENRGLAGPIYLHEISTNDAWVRDHGPLVVRDAQARRIAIDCRFNAWGSKYAPFDDDDAAAVAMAHALALPVLSDPLIFEGGSIDVNGRGLALTTRQCLLNPNRNPGLSETDIAEHLGKLFAIEELIWLSDGIAGDDTDGHVDDISRFVDDAKIVTAVETNPEDVNYPALLANLEILRDWARTSGQTRDIIELPMPPAQYDRGERLPASYANFYIANACVLMPGFGDPLDAEAAAILQGCFPERPVITINARELVKGLGTLHCLTQQIPA